MGNEQNSGINHSGKLNFTFVVDDMWKGLKKTFWVLIPLIGICALLFYFQRKISYKPVYEAYSSYVVNTKSAYKSGDTDYNQMTLGQLKSTFPYILTSGILEQVVAESLGLEKHVPAEITTEAVADSCIFTIRVRAGTAQFAYDVLQATVENYPVVAEYIIGDTQLTKIDESGVPQNMVNPPEYKKHAVYGAAMGILIYTAALFLWAITKKTVRTEEDLQEKISVPYLGSIPQIKKKKFSVKHSPILLERGGNNNELRESLRTVRSRILKRTEQQGIRRILVTSATMGEGKTTIAVNLALSFARKGVKVVLVDGDLRNPSVARTLGLEKTDKGTADVLRGDSKIEDSLITYKDTTLKVLPGSAPLKNPGSLLGSKTMKIMLDSLEDDGYYVIVDTPPCGILADASIIARFVQGAVMVVRQDYTRIEKVMSGIESIADTGIELIGFILNGAEVGLTGYGYGYGKSYGYGYGYGKSYGYGYGYGRGDNFNP